MSYWCAAWHDAPLPLHGRAIDPTQHDVRAAGIKAAGTGAVINSTTGQQEKLDALLPLAAENDASLVALTIDEKGIPRDANGRVEDYAVYLSKDGKNWGKPVMQGKMEADTGLKQLIFDRAATSRFIKFEVLKGSGGYASIAELDIN